MFSTLLENFPPFSLSLKLSSANCFSLEESKISSSGNGLSSLIGLENLCEHNGFLKFPLQVLSPFVLKRIPFTNTKF